MATLEAVYDAEEEQGALALITFPRYARMLEVVHGLVESALPELDAEAFRLDDAATRRLLAKAAEQVVLIDETTRDGLRKVLQEGQERGYSDQQIADGVPKDGFGGVDGLYLNTWKHRAETITRTELSTAQVEASLDRYAATGLVSQVEIVEATDTDDACAARNGKRVLLTARPGLLHPNCLPGDALVWAPDVVGASIRKFEGEMVVLRTAADDLLTCTPNHPVLTDRGWLAAGALREGEYVFRRAAGEGELLVDALHDDHVPARIEEVARALLVAGRGAALTVPGASPQFHGDGRPGDVHVVWANGSPEHKVPASEGEPLVQLQVERGDAQAVPLAGPGAGEPFFERDGASTHSVMRRAGDGAALLRGRAPHPQPHRLGSGAGQPGRLDPLRGGSGRDVVLRADAGTGHPLVHVEAAQRGGVGVLAPPHVVSGGAQLPVQRGGAEPNLLRYGAEGSYLSVAPVQVTEVRHVDFSGHVYNLETRNGWYVAQGIITHNCRMALIPVVKEPALAPAEPPPPTTAQPPEWEYVGTTKEAERAAKARFPNIDFDFEGMHRNTVNPTMKQFVKLAAEYPKVVDRLEYVGGYGRVPAPTGRGQGFDGDSSNAWAHASTDGKRVGLNTRWYGDPTKFQKSLTDSVKWGFHPKGGDTFESVLTHEFGHQVQHWLESVPQDFAAFPVISYNGEGWVGRTAYLWGRTHKANKALSGYATHNKAEGWAEAFAAQYHGTPATKKLAYVRKQAALLKALHPDKWLGRGEWRLISDLPQDERSGAYDRLANWLDTFN